MSLRVSALLFVTLLVLPGGSTTPFSRPTASVTALAEALDEAPRGVPGAEIKLEIKSENGKIAKYTALVESLDERWTFQFEGAGSNHEMSVLLSADAQAKVFHARTTYVRGDGVVVPEFEHDCRYGKREVVSTDGGIVFAFTMKPVLIPDKDKPRDGGDRIDPPKIDDDDPLGGL